MSSIRWNDYQDSKHLGLLVEISKVPIVLSKKIDLESLVQKKGKITSDYISTYFLGCKYIIVSVANTRDVHSPVT